MANGENGEMNGPWYTVIGCLLVGGCMMEEQDDRLAQARTNYESEMKALREQLTEREQQLSRQATGELDLRRRLTRQNDEIAQLRDENRQLQSRLESAQRALQTSQKRLEVFESEQRKDLDQEKQSNAQARAEQEAQIAKLKERVRQLEALLARGGMPQGGASTVPSR
jgi:chromosome segregation ATPase